MKAHSGSGKRLLYVAAIFLVLMAIGAFTPAVWILSGREPESYPELLFALYGLPLALILVAVAAFRWYRLNHTPGGAKQIPDRR